ncbi:aminodeoxychorismate synthase, component I [Pacificimonas flava]|uniref:Probable branched-chain-amino-acid aminotransferase n=2 Tax=Pacificimonas TaxID=1960290 RepID=A0A219B5X3_9SPHN|nr:MULTISPECIES: aminodeoxychorismate synthase component I [Pacificimonas]MBZ6377066.1 aminodeoxychorismate synthase component I [Pacificimonas aurantium]OWV33199.1 aminodeoxychorismate synthase, component I [Pacificimonas flava]
MTFDPARPFLFFDDARLSAARRPGLLFSSPQRWIEARSADAVPGALEEVEAAVAGGWWAAGYLAYEAAAAFEPRMRGETGAARKAGVAPLLRFGLFRQPLETDWERLSASWLTGRRAGVSALSQDLDRSRYLSAIGRILDYIHAGDIYQANFTYAVQGRLQGHPMALYDRLRRVQRMGEGALLHEPAGDWILSASPELFFALTEGRLLARPMKGTARRAAVTDEDLAVRRELMDDPKNRAENLMITDLIRNDLSRIAKPGSVEVRDPFSIETYPTVHQMVTGVEAELRGDASAVDVLRAMFPCGSITGAPKVRAGQIIAETEAARRGIYTGSIGWISPQGHARFNVAIRTVEVAGSGLRLGVGGGIVADSDPEAEWQETRTKAAFLSASGRPFHLIETMRCEEGEVAHLDLHLDRLASSAAYFGFPRPDFEELTERLRGLCRAGEAAKIRLLYGSAGSVSVSSSHCPAPKDELTAAIVPLPVSADDVRLFHKTSDRAFYDDARRAAGTDEVIFIRPDGLLTEGSFTNLFVARGESYATPPSRRGLLPGILRAAMLREHRAQEADLTAADLEEGRVYLGNALRGLLPVRLVALPQGEF